ncbi:MAG: hypothetical protein KKF78_06275 [Candidatus Omnitrophica bacterium]|nr:hypothetical protein [Candidatus Omnitrophota bacterium]MBU1996742.1 hypothetical protein [Candidatus Omnitrophota bacterium]
MFSSVKIGKKHLLTKTSQYYLHVDAHKNLIENALVFARIIKEVSLHQGQLARKAGISQARATQALNLLKLPQGQQNYVLEYGKEKRPTERTVRKDYNRTYTDKNKATN